MYNQREDYGEKVGSENTTDPKKDILQYSPDTSASQQRRTQGARDFPPRIVGEGSGRWGNIHARSKGIGNRGRFSCYWFILPDLGIIGYLLFVSLFVCLDAERPGGFVLIWKS